MPDSTRWSAGGTPALSVLCTGFEHETEHKTEHVAAQRRRTRDDVAERRRLEDEERDRALRAEDYALTQRQAAEDDERRRRLDEKTRGLENEMDALMDVVETEAAEVVRNGQARIAELEEKRKELNRLIDEQL